MISAPILARREPMPQPIKKRFFFDPIGGLFYGFLPIIYPLPNDARIIPEWLFYGICSFVAASVCTVALHEIGHALAGLAVGFELRSLRAWPFTVTSINGKTRISVSLAMTQNQTIMFARRFEHHRRNILVFSCAGVTVNALTVASVVATMRAIAAPVPEFLLFLALLSLRTCILNSVPRRGEALYSDGAVFIDAAVRSARYLRSMAFMQMARAYRSGARVRDLDPVLVDEALALADASRMELLAHVTAYSHFVTRDRVAAEYHLESALALAAKAAPSDRLLLATECVIFTGFYSRDFILANAWARTLARTKLAPYDRLRIDAALAWAAGGRSEAIAILEQLIGDPSVESLWYRDSFIAECRSWIAEMTGDSVAVSSS